jgi:hypothetical protein
MLVQTFGSAVFGISATTVTIEVRIDKGVNFLLVGLPDSAVKESQQRIKTALEESGFHWPGKCITINMAPADIRKVYEATSQTATATVNATNKAKSAAAGLMAKLGPLGPMIATTFSVGAVLAFGKELLATADATVKMADKTGKRQLDISEQIQPARKRDRSRQAEAARSSAPDSTAEWMA